MHGINGRLSLSIHENIFMNIKNSWNQIHQFHIIFIYSFFSSNCGSFFRWFWHKINKKIRETNLATFCWAWSKNIGWEVGKFKCIYEYFMIWPTITTMFWLTSWFYILVKLKKIVFFAFLIVKLSISIIQNPDGAPWSTL